MIKFLCVCDADARKGGEKETLMAANKLIHYQPSPVPSHHDDGEEFDAIPVRARLMLKYLTESEWKIVLMCSDEGEKWMCRVDIEAEKAPSRNLQLQLIRLRILLLSSSSSSPISMPFFRYDGDSNFSPSFFVCLVKSRGNILSSLNVHLRSQEKSIASIRFCRTDRREKIVCNLI